MNQITTEQPESAIGRIMRPLLPAAVKLNVDGLTSRWLEIRLPADFHNSDLNDPGYFRAVQSTTGALSLRKGDHIEAWEYDEAAIWSARVADATMKTATLADLKRIPMKARNDPLHSDDTYRLRWTGAVYQTQRIADGAMIPGTQHPTIEGATRLLMALHTKVA